MARTPIKNRFKDHLTVINDQLIYYLFADKEVESRLSTISVSSEDEYTTDLFPDNEYSERLHVKYSAITAFRDGVTNANKAVCLVLGTEYLLTFMQEAQEFRESVVYDNKCDIVEDAVEDQLYKKLIRWSRHPIEKKIFKTVKYLRLRRNHLVHARTDLRGGLKKIITQDSRELNRYWATKKTRLDDFSFSKKEMNRFSTGEIFSLINLVRVCMEEIDSMIINSVGIEDLLRHEYNLLEIPNIVGKNTVHKTSEKLRSKIQNRYLFDISFSAAEEFVHRRLMNR